MSTGALEDVVEKYLFQARQSGGLGVTLAMAARAELEAIRKAARFYAACPAIVRPTSLPESEGRAAHETVLAIAKEAL